MKRIFRGIFAFAPVVFAACSPAAQTPEAGSEIARTHQTKCGACHIRVEPGTRTRAELDVALARHHKRVHLTDEQWTAMADYLATAPASPASPTSPPQAATQAP